MPRFGGRSGGAARIAASIGSSIDGSVIDGSNVVSVATAATGFRNGCDWTSQDLRLEFAKSATGSASKFNVKTSVVLVPSERLRASRSMSPLSDKPFKAVQTVRLLNSVSSAMLSCFGQHRFSLLA